jgi:DnaJ family protein C protein 28
LFLKHKYLSRNFIERLVEDLIQESMSRGDFKDIRPSGKPLHERNPHYTDFTTYKINEILIDNGRRKIMFNFIFIFISF